MDGVLNLQLPFFYLVHMTVVSIRVSAALLFAPIWGHPGIPKPLRLLLVFSLALSIATMTSFDERSYLRPELVIPSEFLIGILLSMGIRIAFAGLHMAGSLLGFYLGFSSVLTIDPQTSNRSTLMATYLTLCGYVLLLAADQHHFLIRAIADSYRYLPPGTSLPPSNWFEPLMHASAQVFVIGWKIALPVFIATTLVEVAIGLIARMQPQINTMVVSAPLKLLLGLFVLGISLVFIPTLIGDASALILVQK